MKNIRPTLFVLTLALGALFATNAMAQSPQTGPLYNAHEYSRAELITLDTYDSPPIQFTWDVANVSQTPVNLRMDFVITLDVDADTVIAYFNEQSKKNAPVATLQPNILPFESDRDLVVIGRSLNATPARFTLGGTGTHRFIVDVDADGAQTKIMLENRIRNQLFSGTVPPRASMTPKDANPVNFLWN